jgi:hypothetical protein
MDKHNEKWFSNQLNDVLKYKIIPLSPFERLVLLALGSWANKKGECDPSRQQIADFIGTNRSNVSRYLKKLQDLKIITVKKQFIRGKKCMRNNQYIINISALIELSMSENGEIKVKESQPMKVELSPINEQEKDGGGIRSTPDNKIGGGVMVIPGWSHSDTTLYKSNPTATQHPQDIVQGKNLTNPSDPPKAEVLELPPDMFFEEFWATYPRKEKKKESHRIWVKDKLDKIASVIIEDVRQRQLKHDRWSDRRFIPMPSTYLNNEGWTDEITERTYDAHNGKPKQSKTEAGVLTAMADYEKARKRHGL